MVFEMYDAPKAPTPQELLKRINRLETENKHLKQEFREFWKAFETHMDGTANHIGDLYELVYPLVGRVFPELIRTQKQIERIIPSSYVDPSIDKKRKNRKRD